MEFIAHLGLKYSMIQNSILLLSSNQIEAPGKIQDEIAGQNQS